MMDNHTPGIQMETWLVSAGRDRTPGSSLNVPPVPASNFVLGGQYEYARDQGTPTWEALETIVGGLEGGEAVAFASGMGAAAAVFDQVPAGSVVVIPDTCYQGVASLAEAGQAKGNWRREKIRISDTEGWIRACANADLVWLESPSNPLLDIADLQAICAAPRKPGSILAVDNTFATPLNQRPLKLGADVSMQSATKFIGGHSDLLAGVAVTTRPELEAALRKSRKLSGAIPGTFEAFLAVRGARTMALRLARAQQTAMSLATRLEAHPAVARTRYPGLASHPGHEIARQQLKGFGAIVSFEVDGGGEAADRVCASIQLIQHATSLGAVESTMERRAAIPGQEAIPPSLIRLSVGIEDPEDLWKDLDQALLRARRENTG